MKAALYERYGPPDIIRIADVARPAPKANEVSVRVHATTVSRTDCALLRASPFIMRFITGMRKPRNPVLGTDFAGVVEETGKEVKAFKVGDRVFGFDDSGIGSQAEYMVFPETKGIDIIPDGISFEQAAASLEGFHYAVNFANKVVIRPGDKVLVNGATGAIGSATVQLMKYYNADVTAVCRGRDRELVMSLGASKAIDYETEDFTKCGDIFDYVFDAVGKSSFGKCKPLLRSGGVYMSSELGYMGQNLFYALVTPLGGVKKVKFPFPYDVKASIRLVKELYPAGAFTPVIDRKYSLTKIADAYRFAETGEKRGNLVVNIR